ncbi:MAG: hypothetical protein ACRDPD_24290 [Streptosporangiaceae bacterium]
MKLRIKGHLFHCGRCRKSYSHPLGHVCVTRLDRKPRTGKVTLAPEVTATCTRCRKPLGNPLTHTCTTRTDFGARRKAAAKAGKPARPEHRYEACRDEDCHRTACTAYRAGYDAGWPDGYATGRAEAQ